MARNLISHKNYFYDFFQIQDVKTRSKIIYVINLVLEFSFVSKDFCKRVQGTKNIYEIRVNYGNTAIRIMCFFDKGNDLVLLNSFRKKSRKTPLKEIRMASRLYKEYHEEKS